MAQSILNFFSSIFGDSSETPITARSYTELFLEETNIWKLTKEIYDISKQHRNGVTIDYLLRVVPVQAARWAADENIDESSPLGITTEIEVLEHLNRQFINTHYELFRLPQDVPDVNVFRTETYVQDAETGKWENKTPDMILPSDFQSMSMVNPYDRQVSTSFSKYRYGNKIPHWQICGSGARKLNMVDRDRVDGLRHNNPEEASLDVPTYGYDMSSIYSSCHTLNHVPPRARKMATLRK
jgi:hypothetical protein